MQVLPNGIGTQLALLYPLFADQLSILWGDLVSGQLSLLFNPSQLPLLHLQPSLLHLLFHLFDFLLLLLELLLPLLPQLLFQRMRFEGAQGMQEAPLPLIGKARDEPVGKSLEWDAPFNFWFLRF